MTELLDKYLKQIEEKKEKQRIEFLKKAIAALNTVSLELHFKEAYIFGSILKKKKFYDDSDVDIAVVGLKDKYFFSLISRLADLLGRDVDVIQLEKHRLKDKIISEGLLWKRAS
jgi:predicted nucleotidyltransferase